MGCSPSKGKLFSKPDNGSPLENTPMDEAPPDCVKSGLLEEKTCPKVEETATLPLSREYLSDQDQIVEGTDDKVEKRDADAVVAESVTEMHENNDVNESQRRQKNKRRQRLNGRLRNSSITKVDFPPQMVRAHQAAYAFLNPNISKFEGLLELLDQAAHTQLSIQPMMSDLVLCFEEINQALEEMAEEGELMLKEHGDYMALPSGMMGTTVLTALKLNSDKDSQHEPPPDLLQQLLKHSTDKMKHVGGSFQTVGDTALEEAVEYFASLSKLLFEKMKAKHNAEQRIAQVLARVEAAAMGKCNREDSALHSEDSGIGGENDSLTGSDRQRRHRGSAGSGSSGSGTNMRAVLLSNSTTEQNEEEEEGDDMDEEDDDMQMRKRSNSSPPDPCQTFLYIHEILSKEQRPQTAVTDCNVQCPNTKKHAARHEAKMDTTGVRRHSTCGAGSSKRLSKTQNPKLPSVRRLIHTFGQTGQNWNNTLTNVRRSRKTTPTEGTQVSSWPQNREDPDDDNLPPPPPEVLMDDSFQITESISTNEKAHQNNAFSTTNKRQGLHSRLKTTVELLPNRTSIKQKLPNLSSACLTPQNITLSAQKLVQQQESLDADDNLYEQARTIIHMRSAAGPLLNTLQKSDSADVHEGDMSFSLPVIAPPVSRVRLPPSCPPVRHRYPSPPVRPQSSNSRPSSPKAITRASDNAVEQIIPSVSFKDARSVFCQNETRHQPYNSAGASVLPRPWGEGSRGRSGTRTTDSPRRTQSEHRPTITIRTGGAKHDHPIVANGQ